MAVLLIADHDNKALNSITAKALTAAKAIGGFGGGDVHILVTGYGCRSVAESAAKLQGVAKVLLAEGPQLEHRLAEETAAVIVAVMAGYDAVLQAATSVGKNVLPRVAALLDVSQLSDITAVKSADTFERGIYAGNAIQIVQSTDKKKVITVRTASFQATPPVDGGGGSAPIEAAPATALAGLSTFEKAELSRSDRPELTAARIIVSGGRGMQSGDNFKKYIEPLADTLGAAMGASRAAVDAGFVPNDYQVGQTGKVVAPELYVAVGISGAIQHLAGMKDSKVIVAINKDAEAPIFQVADYGLVADLFTAVPEFDAELKKAKAKG